MLRYILTISYNGDVVVTLYYEDFSIAHGVATLLKGGIAYENAYRIEIYDDVEKLTIYKEFSY